MQYFTHGLGVDLDLLDRVRAARKKKPKRAKPTDAQKKAYKVKKQQEKKQQETIILKHRRDELARRHRKKIQATKTKEFRDAYETYTGVKWDATLTDPIEILEKIKLLVLALELFNSNTFLTPAIKKQYLIKHGALYPGQKRYVRLLSATPPWADMDAIKAVYSERDRIIAVTGEDHHVDHIIPLQGDLVCGLHVAENLQILTKAANLGKNNKFT